MPRKKKEGLEAVSFSDLYMMYLFVSGDAGRTFGPNTDAKKEVREKLKVLEDELYRRVYGKNPFMPITITGVEPTSIDLSKFAAPIKDGAITEKTSESEITEDKKFIVVQDPLTEPKDQTPQTFVVFDESSEKDDGK